MPPGRAGCRADIRPWPEGTFHLESHPLPGARDPRAPRLRCTALSASLPLLPPVLRQESRWAGLLLFQGVRNSEVPDSQGVQCRAGTLELSHPGPFYRCLKKLRTKTGRTGKDTGCLQLDLGRGTSAGVLQESCWAAVEPEPENMTSLSTA